MEWLSVDGMTEWFDKMGRDFNRVMKGDAGELEKAMKTGILSLRDGEWMFDPAYQVLVGHPGGPTPTLV